MTRHIPHWFWAFAALMVTGAFLLDVVGDLATRLNGEPDPRPTPGDADMVTLAAELIDQLQIAPETGHGTYRRDHFGTGWSTHDNGCDTRDLVLIEESILEPTVTESCTVAAGQWTSWFDGQSATEPSALDVDHLVPLAEAWASGAHTWSPEQRRQFANDLDRPDALVAVTAASNRSKGDRDPAAWLPDEPAVWCRYTAGWVIQKHAWGLTADEGEHTQLAEILDDCTSEEGNNDA